jgi:hypothetical protein
VWEVDSNDIGTCRKCGAIIDYKTKLDKFYKSMRMSMRRTTKYFGSEVPK